MHHGRFISSCVATHEKILIVNWALQISTKLLFHAIYLVLMNSE